MPFVDLRTTAVSNNQTSSHRPLHHENKRIHKRKIKGIPSFDNTIVYKNYQTAQNQTF